MSFYYSKSFVLSAQEFPGAPGVITEGHPLSGWGGASLEFSEFGFQLLPAAPAAHLLQYNGFPAAA